MKRYHRMPFGAEVTDSGVRFRLFAPAARRVDVRLEGERPVFIPMYAVDEGWHEVVATGATENTLYRFRIDGDDGLYLPDPASRYQPADVHGPSEVIGPGYVWRDREWRGRPWEEAVLYELHVGTFSPEGTFRGVMDRLGYLADLGITAVELMPVADFPGQRNWGYDGVYPFAPDSRYGRPEELKALVEACHERGLMIFLDVVYNHFGPEGNYLHRYAPQFFTERHHTPWGAAINFDDAGSAPVRRFFIHSALYWLEEYHFDGLRFDAVHAIFDDSHPDILEEIAVAVAEHFGNNRHIHLVLENDNNAAHYLRRDSVLAPERYVAQWNDDVHHALHVLATGEQGGYYLDYADSPLRHLGRCLTEGFAYQGEPSAYREGARRGEPSAHLPPTAFVAFIQNHDQVGNRAFGERIGALAPEAAVRAISAMLLLAPSPPLLFMGQEWNTRTPFPFFCDFGRDLAQAVTQGRRQEFARFAEFSDPEQRERIPDPAAGSTFESARLEWPEAQGPEADWQGWHRHLLTLRRRAIVPRLGRITGGASNYELIKERALRARWRLGDGSTLQLAANLSADPVDGLRPASERPLLSQPEEAAEALEGGRLPPWSVVWWLEQAGQP